MPLEVSPTQKDINNYNLSINNLEKIADELAIGFAEWMGKKENLMHLIKIGYTTKELLEIYKKEKL
jgi:hypothetical protein